MVETFSQNTETSSGSRDYVTTGPVELKEVVQISFLLTLFRVYWIRYYMVLDVQWCMAQCVVEAMTLGTLPYWCAGVVL